MTLKKNHDSRFSLDDYPAVVEVLFDAIENKQPTLEALPGVVREVTPELVGVFVRHHRLPEVLNDPKALECFLEELREEYTLRRGVTLPVGQMLSGSAYRSWLDKAIEEGSVTLKSYGLYQQHLSKKDGFGKESLANLDKITHDIVDHMGDPRSPQGFKSYGLLMGDVQAGKTATYTGVIHKALDAGYRFIVVLSGTKTSLRNQTQQRLNADLLGTAVNREGRQVTTIEGLPHLWQSLTDNSHDLRKSDVDKVIALNNEMQCCIAVMQKNAKTLRNFLDLLERNEKLGIRNVPLLFVDDEADQASVNVNKKTEDPTAINQLIRDILSRFDRSAYLAVTATPFANVFIDPMLDDKGMPQQGKLPDLFPRDYIYTMATPDAYVGVERFFGQRGDFERDSFKYRCLIPMALGEDGSADEEDFSDDITKKAEGGGLRQGDVIDRLPDSLSRAVLYFLCVLTMKELNPVLRNNTSMLVHIARYRDVQKALREKIDDYVEKVQAYAEAENGRILDSYPPDGLFAQLEALWDRGCGEELWMSETTDDDPPPTLRELTGRSWRDVWKNDFRKAIRGVKVVEVNMNSKLKDLAVFFKNKDAKLIAVGGDALARGLTLEGLCVVYFSRRSKAYDSLLQMGRWFGYRERMRNYMKIWISDLLVQQYKYVAEAVVEFRELVEDMRRRNMTPSEFGLKIRLAPKQFEMMVTASNKRRTSRRVKGAVEITGRKFQASTFPNDPLLRQSNTKTVAAFLKSLGAQSTRYGRAAAADVSKGRKDLVWEGVASGRIADLLTDYVCPVWSENEDIVPLRQKIRERGDKWTVRVVSLAKEEGGKFRDDVFGFGRGGEITCSERAMEEKADWIQPGNREVSGPQEFCRHLTPADERERLAEINEGVEVPKKSYTFSDVMRNPKEPPQLLIYSLRPGMPEKAKACAAKKAAGAGLQADSLPVGAWYEDETIVALALGIPGTGNGKNDVMDVEYETNRVYQLWGHDGPRGRL